MDKDEQESLPTAPEVGKAPKKVPVSVSAPEPELETEADDPKADEPEFEVADVESAEEEPEQTAEPEPAQPVPQLIRGTASTKTPEPKYDDEIDERDEADTEVAEPTGTLADQQAKEATEPEAEDFLADEDEDEADKDYDPGRGDYVDHLNDTTPPPAAPAAAPKPKKKKSGKRWVWVLIVLLLAAAGAGAYFYLTTKKASAPEPTNTSTTQSTTQKAAEETKTTVAVKTKHYDSNTFAMGLDYPETWKVNETTTLLSVTSPQMSLKATSGTKTDGYIFVTVQPKQTTLPDFAKGSAVAVLQSEKATYKNPTQNQRAQTYMTFASYAATTGKGWDAVYVTGNNGYQVDQYIPMSDIIQTDPLVTVKFLSCTSQACTGTTKPLTLDVSEWKNTTVSDPMKTIIQSFTFN